MEVWFQTFSIISSSLIEPFECGDGGVSILSAFLVVLQPRLAIPVSPSNILRAGDQVFSRSGKFVKTYTEVSSSVRFLVSTRKKYTNTSSNAIHAQYTICSDLLATEFISMRACSIYVVFPTDCLEGQGVYVLIENQRC